MIGKSAQALWSWICFQRRRGLTLGSALTLGMSILSLGGSCNKPLPPMPQPPTVPTGQTLRVASFVDYFGMRTLPSFETKTGNHVSLEAFQSNESLLAHIDSRRFDVVFLSGYAVEGMIASGRLATMPRERVPNLAQVPIDFRNPPYDPSLSHCVPYIWWVIGFAYLPPKSGHSSEPGSLDVLFAPSGPEIAWLDDMRAMLGMALIKLGRSPNSHDAADLTAARDLLIAAAPRVVELVDDPGALLQSGRISVSMGWSNDVFALARRDSRVRFLLPKDGTLLYVDFVCVLANAQQPEVAWAFLDHLLEPTISAEIANTRMIPTVSEGGRQMMDTEARWMWGTLEQLRGRRSSYEPLRDVGDATPLYEKTWQEVKTAFAQVKARRAAQVPVSPPVEKKPAPIKGKKWISPL
jgi:spermidine/putrescine transport system substrate-binding protein